MIISKLGYSEFQFKGPADENSYQGPWDVKSTHDSDTD